MVGGGIWPVVDRELRAGARRPFNHWLRVAGALGGVGVFCLSAWNAPVTIVGSRIFFGIHRLLMLLILCVVPAITADCIARERREGTLGLLFLTPLQAWEIVVGKVLVQVLKALTLWLAVVPVLAIPFLMGGVGRRELVSQLSTELCAGMFCLAAGIVASSLTEKRATAFVLAFAFAAALVFGLTAERWWTLLRWKPQTFAYVISGWQRLVTVPGSAGMGYYFVPRPFPPAFVLAGPKLAVISLWPLEERFLFALLVLWGCVRFAGFCVEKSWKDKLPSARSENWAKIYCAPVFRRRFASQMRRTLEWNPIAWLQQYSWKARLTKWGLCLAFTVLMCMASEPRDVGEIIERESIVLAVLAAAYTYAGVNGFLQEKKSGALELILVTPLTVDQIIFGRVWGLWKQFFPAALLLWTCYHVLRLIDPNWNYAAQNYNGLTAFAGRYGMEYCLDFLMANSPLREFAVIVGFFALPVYATLSALRVRNIVLAALYTWLALLVAPLAGAGLVQVVAGYDPQIADVAPDLGWFCLGVLAGHAALVVLAFWDLRQRLARRDYAF